MSKSNSGGDDDRGIVEDESDVDDRGGSGGCSTCRKVTVVSMVIDELLKMKVTLMIEGVVVGVQRVDK